MCDDEGGSPDHQALQRFLNERFILGVNTGKCLIEEQDRGIFE